MMKRKTISRLYTLLLAVFLLGGLLPPQQALAAGTAPVSSTNINTQEYVNGRRWAKTVRSFLYENSSGGLTRVEYADSQVIVEDYNSQFQLQSSRTVPMELPIWGGFFAGKDCNFLMFGQDNEEEDDAKEVIRIVKYSKDWQRLGAVGLFGANTIHPFDGGSARFAEYNGYLYVRTCHKMYTSSDGLNHQANVMINVRQSDMEITDSFTKVMNVRYGYVSHSFNQFVIVDQDGRIVALDHGDAGDTRAAVLLRYNAKAGQGSFMQEEMVPLGGNRYTYSYCNHTSVQAFPTAPVHYNDTGAALGGFVETSSGYVTAYNFDGTASNLGTDPRDVYLAFTDKSLSNTTAFKLSSGGDTSVPVLAPTGLDGGYVMWNGRTSSSWYSFSCDDTLHYARYDANGKADPVQTATAALSDCAPIFWNGKVVWYVTNRSVPTFYTLDSSGVTAHTATAGTGTPAAISYANTQTVLLDGKSVTFQTYALKDGNGNMTNYIRLRDLAYYLNGTPAQFSVDWQAGQGIILTSGRAYVPTGIELSTPFSGNQPYGRAAGQTVVNGNAADLDAISLVNGSYTYYKLRDLGQSLGFNVSYISDQVVINTNEPYSDAQ